MNADMVMTGLLLKQNSQNCSLILSENKKRRKPLDFQSSNLKSNTMKNTMQR